MLADLANPRNDARWIGLPASTISAPDLSTYIAILAHRVNVVPVSLLGASFLLLGRESLSLNMGLLRRKPELVVAEATPEG